MDSEMQKLGLKPSLVERKASIDSKALKNNQNNSKIPIINSIEAETFFDDLEQEEERDIVIQEEEDRIKKEEIKETEKKKEESNDLRNRFTNSYYNKRLSHIGLMTAKNVDSATNISTMRRKYSLDSKLTAQSLLPNRNTSSQVKKSSSRRSFNESKDNFELQFSTSTIISPSKADFELGTVAVTPLLNSKTSPTLMRNQIAHNSLSASNFTINNSSALSSSQNYKLEKSILSINSQSSLQVPSQRLLRSAKSGSKSALKDDNRACTSSSCSINSGGLNDSSSKRRVSFGQIELSQLEIPVVYKYSNLGLEKYKLNPNFYLPDGSLKRKFSLPKLGDTIGVVKECGYIRLNSIETDKPSHYEIVNIFKDLDPSPSEMRNFDFGTHSNENEVNDTNNQATMSNVKSSIQFF
jgi:hypothetical protein